MRRLFLITVLFTSLFAKAQSEALIVILPSPSATSEELGPDFQSKRRAFYYVKDPLTTKLPLQTHNYSSGIEMLSVEALDKMLSKDALKPLFADNLRISQRFSDHTFLNRVQFLLWHYPSAPKPSSQDVYELIKEVGELWELRQKKQTTSHSVQSDWSDQIIRLGEWFFYLFDPTEKIENMNRITEVFRYLDQTLFKDWLQNKKKARYYLENQLAEFEKERLGLESIIWERSFYFLGSPDEQVREYARQRFYQSLMAGSQQKVPGTPLYKYEEWFLKKLSETPLVWPVSVDSWQLKRNITILFKDLLLQSKKPKFRRSLWSSAYKFFGSLSESEREKLKSEISIVEYVFYSDKHSRNNKRLMSTVFQDPSLCGRRL